MKTQTRMREAIRNVERQCGKLKERDKALLKAAWRIKRINGNGDCNEKEPS